MNDDALRALVRDAIARQMAAPASGGRRDHAGPAMADPRLHASHAIYMIPRRDGPEGPSGNDDDSSCVIEPSVACTHCNYCKSHGH